MDNLNAAKGTMKATKDAGRTLKEQGIELGAHQINIMKLNTLGAIAYALIDIAESLKTLPQTLAAVNGIDTTK